MRSFEDETIDPIRAREDDPATLAPPNSKDDRADPDIQRAPIAFDPDETLRFGSIRSDLEPEVTGRSGSGS
jgi:hypothetical protein